MTKDEYLALADMHDGRLGRPNIGDVFLMGCGAPNIYNGKNTNKNLLGGNRLILPYIWVVDPNQQGVTTPHTIRACDLPNYSNLTVISSLDELATRIALEDVIEPIEEASMYLTDGYILDINGSHKHMGPERDIPPDRPRTFYSDLRNNPSTVMIPYEASDALDFLVKTVLGCIRISEETYHYLKLKVPHTRLKTPDVYERYIDTGNLSTESEGLSVTVHQSPSDISKNISPAIAGGKRWIVKKAGRILLPNGKHIVFSTQNGNVIRSLSATYHIDEKRITVIDVKNPIFADPTVDLWNLKAENVSFYVEVPNGNEVYIPTDEEYKKDILDETKFQLKDIMRTISHSGVSDSEMGEAKRALEEAISILSKSKKI